MTPGKAPLTTLTQHYSRDHTTGVHGANGDWSPWCSCGWIETGWPSSKIARASLENHLLKAHPDSLAPYTVTS